VAAKVVLQPMLWSYHRLWLEQVLIRVLVIFHGFPLFFIIVGNRCTCLVWGGIPIFFNFLLFEHAVFGCFVFSGMRKKDLARRLDEEISVKASPAHPIDL